MRHRLKEHIDQIANVSLRRVCANLLTSHHFMVAPASLKFHHTYEGGLLAHTVDVCDLAMQMIGQTTQRSLDILRAASLWHDFCKGNEYRRVSHDDTVEWVHTNYGRRIHHIAGSTMEFTVAARIAGIDDGMIEEIQHCILAHHGRREWGSPVEPQTLEAMTLHHADMVSAHFGKTKDRMINQ